MGIRGKDLKQLEYFRCEKSNGQLKRIREILQRDGEL